MPERRPSARKAGPAVPERGTTGRRRPPRPPAPEVGPKMFAREWERGTALVSLFVATGSFYELRKDAQEGSRPRCKPANLLLVSDPGRGKTELLDRFRVNTNIEYRSDLTVRGLWRLLAHADRGACSHVGATEFQKFFQRKQSTADNLMGTLCQAMEEGVEKLDVMGRVHRFSPPARIGLIGAITSGTVDKKQDYLKEMGFLSRTAVLTWELPVEEVDDILRRISEGEVDLSPVRLTLPDKLLPINFPSAMSRRLEPYVKQFWRTDALRVFTRFRQLVMAACVLDGRDVVTDKDVDFLHEFDEYWKRMVID